MPRDSAHAPQLPLFVHDTVSYPDALARYEAIRPVLTGERSLRQQSHQTGINYWRLWRDLRRFRRDGLLGLIDRRALPHARGKPAAHVCLPRHIQQHVVRLAIAAVPKKRRRSWLISSTILIVSLGQPP
jgi:leucine-zipper of insertion element IS481